MGTRLYVGNLPYGIQEAELRTLFEEEGRKVVDVRLITDRMTGQARGFGFVEMGSDADAQAAIQSLHGRAVSGRSMVVNEARDREPGGRPGGPGGPRPPFRGGPGGDRPPPRVDRVGPPGGGGGYRSGPGGGPPGPRPGGGGGRPFGGGGGFGGGPPGSIAKGGDRRRKSEKKTKEEHDRERRASGRGKRFDNDDDWRQDMAETEGDAPDPDYTGDDDSGEV